MISFRWNGTPAYLKSKFENNVFNTHTQVDDNLKYRKREFFVENMIRRFVVYLWKSNHVE